MSRGDIIRLNRMYKCDMNWLQAANTSIFEPSLSATFNPIETPTTDVGGDFKEKSKESSTTQEWENEEEQREPRTILAVLMFKLVGKN